LPRRVDPMEAFVAAMNAYAECEDHGPALLMLDAAQLALQAVRDQELLDAIGHGDTHAYLASELGVSRQAISSQVAAARNREARRRSAGKRLEREGHAANRTGE
jgi:hypothetical protein